MGVFFFSAMKHKFPNAACPGSKHQASQPRASQMPFWVPSRVTFRRTNLGTRNLDFLFFLLCILKSVFLKALHESQWNKYQGKRLTHRKGQRTVGLWGDAQGLIKMETLRTGSVLPGFYCCDKDTSLGREGFISPYNFQCIWQEARTRAQVRKKP